MEQRSESSDPKNQLHTCSQSFKVLGVNISDSQGKSGLHLEYAILPMILSETRNRSTTPFNHLGPPVGPHLSPVTCHRADYADFFTFKHMKEQILLPDLDSVSNVSPSPPATLTPSSIHRLFRPSCQSGWRLWDEKARSGEMKKKKGLSGNVRRREIMPQERNTQVRE